MKPIFKTKNYKLVTVLAVQILPQSIILTARYYLLRLKKIKYIIITIMLIIIFSLGKSLFLKNMYATEMEQSVN